jgi:hypothetical protein
MPFDGGRAEDPMHRTLLLLLPLAVPFAACGTSSRLVEDGMTQPMEIAAVGLGDVRFDYSSWTNRDQRDHDTAKQNEAVWSRTIGDAFLARATALGLGGGDNRTLVDITIVDLDPGNRVQRSGLGFGDGKGIVTAVVAPRGHGSFRLNGEIGVGAWGGDFAAVLEKLGREAADHIAERSGRKR